MASLGHNEIMIWEFYHYITSLQNKPWTVGIFIGRYFSIPYAKERAWQLCIILMKYLRNLCLRRVFLGSPHTMPTCLPPATVINGHNSWETVNYLRPSDAHMPPQWTRSLFPVKTWHPLKNIPLPDKCGCVGNWTPQNKLESKYHDSYSIRCIWKWLQQNGGHFISTWMGGTILKD